MKHCDKKSCVIAKVAIFNAISWAKFKPWLTALSFGVTTTDVTRREVCPCIGISLLCGRYGVCVNKCEVGWNNLSKWRWGPGKNNILINMNYIWISPFKTFTPWLFRGHSPTLLEGSRDRSWLSGMQHLQ